MWVGGFVLPGKGRGEMSRLALSIQEDFSCLTRFLPLHWQEKAKELGALRRCRKVPDAQTLLRVLLIHLAEGRSLRETAAIVRKRNLAEISDVAIMDRLRMSAEWFRWMNIGIMKQWIGRLPTSLLDSKYNVRLVDGTQVDEPGLRGSSWNIHYSIGLPSLGCGEFIASPTQDGVAGFDRFSVNSGDLFVADQAYGLVPGIFHVVQGGADVLVRFAEAGLPLMTEQRSPFDLTKHLRRLKGNKVGQWPVRLEWNELALRGRVCAIRKSRQAEEKACNRIRLHAIGNGMKLEPRALETAGYTYLFTTLEPAKLRAERVLEIDQGRSQIEAVLERLKSVLGLGHLRKTDDRAAVAWIHGKLLVAFLSEVLEGQAGNFLPKQYPQHYETPSINPLSLASSPIRAALLADGASTSV